MGIKDLRDVIADRVAITHQMVTLAKSYIVTYYDPCVSTMLEQFLHEQNTPLGQPVQLIETDSSQTDTQAANVARFLSWQLAFVEALWQLLNSGTLLPYNDSTQQTTTTIDYTQGRRRSGWQFDEFRYSYPSIVRLAPTALKQMPQPLSNPDLFLSDLAIPDIHPGVAASLHLAVKCFRHDLYLPCIAMLGRASEGAWLELGRSLLKVPGLPGSYCNKITGELENDRVSIFAKMKRIADMYRSQALFKSIAERSHTSDHLEEVRMWSEVIRDTRNIVHYQEDSSVEIDYEKTAALLMGVAKNLRTLYNIRRVAEEAAQKNSSTQNGTDS